jgi:uncharacterized protein (DUF427 family)
MQHDVVSRRIEPVAKRIRAFVEGRPVLDTTRAVLLFDPPRIPIYWVPRADVSAEVLAKSADAIVHPPADLAALADMVHLCWEAMDAWFEEDDEVIVHAHDPYHRIDVLQSSRHVEVFVDGVAIADSRRPIIVFETTLRPRWYLPKLDVRMDLLVPSATRTGCAYKGIAQYWSIRTGETKLDDVVWGYAQPLVEATRIANLVAFYDEKLDVRVDGQRVQGGDVDAH